jgi:hypothetical protein
VKIRVTGGGGYRVIVIRFALDPCRSRQHEMPLCALIQHGARVYHVIAWPIALATAAVLVGCSDVVAPDVREAGDSTPLVDLARPRKETRPPPDSVGIPPMPVPPIYEELPPILDEG